ncbi:MAG: HipA domain-containing protein, partial [Phascolarctobacterium sp.]|nr:HipA domain-containing protein [Candidatus Phascolarctobacterium caballi]
MSKVIYVYENNIEDIDALVGQVYVEEINGREVFSFEYAEEWLCGHIGEVSFDPNINMYAGRQYLNGQKNIFGMLADSCPDRWGRMLMQRKESIIAKKENRHPKKLLESDFLLGVYDGARIGSLRFKLDKNGEFLANDKNLSVPPWVALRKLENASMAFEQGDSDKEWLEILIAPGSSLGGARPKATVQDEKGNLWIAKFPSKHDEYDVGAWEMVVHDLAVMVGLDVPKARLEKFSDKGSTFLVQRFDR